MALPQGALDALKSGGTEAFDQVVAEDRAATQAAMKPAVANNEYNRSGPSRGEHAALGRYFAERSQRDGDRPQSPSELQAVRDHAVEKYMREHPGADRRAVEAAWEREIAEARAKLNAEKEEAKGVVLADPNLADTPIEDLRRMAGTEMPRLPEPYKDEWDTELEHDFLSFGVANGIKSQTLQQVLEFYTDAAVIGVNSIEQAERDFHQRFERQLTKPQREILLKFWRTDLLGPSDGSKE